MKNKRILSLVLAFAMLLGTFSFAFADKVVVPTEEDYKEANVTDVIGNDYETAFAKLMAVGVAQGKGEKGADLDANLTRAEAAKMVLHMLGLQEGIVNYGPSGNKFKDVTNKHWASQYIAVAADHGVVTGHTDGTFRPEDPVTEDQIVAMIVRALEWGPIVGGNYPYGEYAKALELGIIGKAPIYNKIATRGYAFQVAANSLTAKMAERSATEDKLTYHGEGYRNLLNHRLHVASLNEVAVVRTARMERDYEAGEFTTVHPVWNDSRRVYVNESNTFIYDGKEFDATTILGDFVNVWYRDNKVRGSYEVVYVEKNSNFSKVSGIVEEVDTKKWTVKLENGRTYNLEEVEVYRNNRRNVLPAEGDLVTLTLNSKNEVVFADAFDITVGEGADYLNIVSKIVKDEVKDNRFVYEDQVGTKRVISNEKLIVFKDGKVTDVDAIEELDLIREVEVDRQAKTSFVYVLGEQVKGKITEVGYDTRRSDDRKVVVKVDDEDGLVVDHKNFISLSDDYKVANELNKLEDVYDELKDYVDEDVTLITVAGKVKVLVAKAQPKTVLTGLALRAGLHNRYSDIGSIEILNQAGEKKDLEFTNKELDKDVYVFNKIDNRYSNDGSKLDKYPYVKHDGNHVTLFYNEANNGRFVYRNALQASQVNNIELGKGAKFEGLDKRVLKTSDGNFDIAPETVFYLPTYNSDGDMTGYTVAKYSDLVKSTAEGDVRLAVFEAKGEKNKKTPTVDVVVVTKGELLPHKEYEYGIVEYVGHRADETYYEVYTKEGKVERFKAHKDSKAAEKEQAIKYTIVGEDTIKIEAVGEEGVLYDIKSGEYKIAPFDADGKLEEAKWYKKSEDGIIIRNDDLFRRADEVVVYFFEDGYDKLRVLNYVKVYDGKEKPKDDVKADGELYLAYTVGSEGTLRLKVKDEVVSYQVTKDAVVLDKNGEIVEKDVVIPAGTKANITLVKGTDIVDIIELVEFEVEKDPVEPVDPEDPEDPDAPKLVKAEYKKDETLPIVYLTIEVENIPGAAQYVVYYEGGKTDPAAFEKTDNSIPSPVADKPVKIEILDADGDVLHTFENVLLTKVD